MHLLSLGIHLVNVLLVGLLAQSLLRECSETPAAGRIETVAWPFFGMCVYALHPALVEPVVWISAQYDLLTTGFMLLGLLLNLRQRNVALRTASVSACFFLAACSKEAALSFPFMVATFDWICTKHPEKQQPGHSNARYALQAMLSRQWQVYAAVLAAGVVYLCLRIWSIGFLINPDTKATWSFLPQLQMASYTYLAYWKLIVWPMSGLAPMYEVNATTFASMSPELLAINVGAIAIATLGLWQLARRAALGAIVASATAALLPVLHIFPQEFAGSLYHCRYAMTAIASVCALLPLLLHSAKLRERSALFTRSLTLVGGTWLVFAAINTQACIPLWSDEVKLWQWALLTNPGASKAEESLLAAYIRAGDLSRAEPLADAIMQGGTRSFGGMLDVTALRITQRDAEGATLALAEAKKSMNRATIRRSYLRSFMLLSGQVGELRNDLAEAEEAYSAAIAFEPQLPEAHMRLAIVRAHAGRIDDARILYDKALALYAPADRERIRRQFDPLFTAPPMR
jgi:tetratricopeptide (TPR) repeat protein